MGQPFDAYHKWLGIPKEDQPPNHYRLLGIQVFETDPDVIESAADQRMAHVRGYQSGRHADLSQRILNEVAAARVCLLNPAKRTAYNEQLKQTVLPVASPMSAESNSAIPIMIDVGNALSPRAARQQAAIRAARRKQQLPIGPILGIVAAVGFVFALIIVLNVASKKTPPPVSPPSVKSTPSPAKPDKKKLPPALPKPPQPPKKTPAPKQAEQAKPKPQAISPAAPDAVEDLVLDESPPKEQKNKAVLKVEPHEAGSSAEASDPTDEMLVAGQPQFRPEKPSQVAAPSVEDQEAAIAQARDLYKDAFARAKTPELRQSLATTLLNQAEQQTAGEAATAFALLKLACELSTQASDGAAAFHAINVMAEKFDIEPTTMKADILAELATKARTTLQHSSIAEQAADLMDDAAAAGNFAQADQFAKLAAAESAKGHDKLLVTRVRERLQDIRVAQKLTAEFEAAQAKLADQPEDPEANSTAALYHCFLIGDWEKGLPYLAKGGDDGMKALAQRELDKSPRDPEGRVNLADAWWDLAQRASGKRKEKMLLHAGTWYTKAQPAVTDGLIKAKIDKRLDDIEKLDRKLRVRSSPEF